MPATYSPPPPPIDLIPDTGAHGAMLGDHESRMRAMEKCLNQLTVLSRERKKGEETEAGFRRWVIGLLVSGIIGIAGAALTFYTGSVRAGERVEANTATIDEVEADVSSVREDVGELRTGVVGLKTTLQSSERASARRDSQTQRRLDEIADRLNGRRRR